MAMAPAAHRQRGERRAKKCRRAQHADLHLSQAEREQVRRQHHRDEAVGEGAQRAGREEPRDQRALHHAWSASYITMPCASISWSSAKLVESPCEIASSPLQNINDFGPAVVASDFGNNAGLLLGAEVGDWQARSLESLLCETRIDGAVVGRGSAAAVSGGPLTALAFALRCNARRGRPLRAGEFVSTGAATGVHSIRAGQSAEAIFTGIGSLRCMTVPMKPAS